MPKFIAICLLLLLPLQWNWAAAAVYCAHGALGDSQHFGHHGASAPVSDRHATTGGSDAIDASDPLEKLGAVASDTATASAPDADCGACERSLVQAVVPSVPSVSGPLRSAAAFSYWTTWPDSPARTVFRPPLHQLT